MSGDQHAPGRRMIPESEITLLLAAARGGEPDAAQRLFALVYQDLRRLAARHLGDRRGLGATSLVHEAFLRLARHGSLPYEDRRHFFAVASRAMRQIVIDNARARQADKRGGGVAALDVDGADAQAALSTASGPAEVLRVDAALGELERDEPGLAEIIEWHFFGGLTFAEIAEALAVSERTVLRRWRAARALLHARLSSGDFD
jgi:RNA polymerase sigma factor (TIGR02999 family)